MNLPIICTLTEEELRERKDTILASIRDAVLRKTVIPGGYRYEFVNDGTTLQNVRRMVELERQCCQFLTFDLAEGEKTVELDVIGPTEALQIIGDFFG